MPRLTKEERTQQIVNALNNYYLGLAAVAVFENREIYQRLNDVTVELGGKYGFELKTVVALLEQQDLESGARLEFKKMLMRMLLKESFEMVRKYAIEHSLKAKLRSQEWFQVARMLRNCLSHSFKFEFKPYEFGLLPVAWNGLEITSAMHNQYLLMGDFNPAFLRELVLEFREFIKNN